MIWILLNILVTLVSMPFVIKKEDWKLSNCFIYFIIVFGFTPLIGIPLFIFASKL